MAITSKTINCIHLYVSKHMDCRSWWTFRLWKGAIDSSDRYVVVILKDNVVGGSCHGIVCLFFVGKWYNWLCGYWQKKIFLRSTTGRIKNPCKLILMVNVTISRLKKLSETWHLRAHKASACSSNRWEGMALDKVPLGSGRLYLLAFKYFNSAI